MSKVDKIYSSHNNYRFLGSSDNNQFVYSETLSHKSILAVFMMALFIIMFFQSTFNIGAGQMSFRGFLEMLSSVPSIDISWIGRITSVNVPDIPVIGSFLRIFVGTFGALLYFVTGVAQLIVFIGYIVGFLMGVV